LKRIRPVFSIPVNLPLSLLRGATLSIGIRVIGLALAFLAQVLISRMSGADAYGLYMYCFAWLALLLVFTRSGTDEALIRFLPELAHDEENRQSLIHWAHARTVPPAWLLMLLMLMLAAGLYVMSDPGFAVILASIAMFVPVLTLLWIYQARLRSAGRTLAAFLPNEILRPVMLIALLVGFFAAGSRPSVSTLLWLSLLATVTAVSMMAGFAHETGARIPSHAVDAGRQWNRTANHFFLISLCVLGTTTIDILVVGTVLDAEQTGYYAAAQRLASLAGFGSMAITLIVAPMLPALLADPKRRPETERLLRYGARLATFFVIAVGLAMWFTRDALLGMFGNGYEVAGNTLGVLLLAQLITAASGSVITLMMMSGDERLALMIIAGCSVVNLVLCSLLTLKFGLSGAAIAILVVSVLQQAGLSILAQQRLGIRTDCL
jgi:O-antigen/teichoic acid export membrane protein